MDMPYYKGGGLSLCNLGGKLGQNVLLRRREGLLAFAFGRRLGGAMP